MPAAGFSLNFLPLVWRQFPLGFAHTIVFLLPVAQAPSQTIFCISVSYVPNIKFFPNLSMSFNNNTRIVVIRTLFVRHRLAKIARLNNDYMILSYLSDYFNSFIQLWVFVLFFVFNCAPYFNIGRQTFFADLIAMGRKPFCGCYL